ncbi:MAG: hypothetical protein IKG83_03225 [Prevotella sp.]|nr:hypothetical protein [Prevotella sp.]
MDDLISRQAAIEAVKDLPNCDNGFSDTYDKARIIGVLDELPTAEPRTGKWIKDRLSSTLGGSYGVYRCSECESSYQDIGYGWNYCPNCGAKMEN